MIVMPEHHALFVSTPKCGTNTFYSILKQHYGGQRVGRFHDRDVPAEYREWFVFSIVRNPYSRAVSTWYSTTVNRDNKRYAYDALGTTCFHTFLRFLLARPPMLETRSLSIPQAEWLQDVPLSRLLHLESIDGDVRALPFWRDEPLPRLNASTGCDPWQRYVDREAAELIERWAPDDFERFGYSRLSAG